MCVRTLASAPSQESADPSPSDRLCSSSLGQVDGIEAVRKRQVWETDRPVALLDQQLLHKTDLDQSRLISCRLWALNSATSHSSHKRLRCKVNSIDNYCSECISRPLLCNLEVTAAEEAQCMQKRISDIVLTNPNFKPDNDLFYQKIKLIQWKIWMS